MNPSTPAVWEAFTALFFQLPPPRKRNYLYSVKRETSNKHKRRKRGQVSAAARRILHTNVCCGRVDFMPWERPQRRTQREDEGGGTRAAGVSGTPQGHPLHGARLQALTVGLDDLKRSFPALRVL